MQLLLPSDSTIAGVDCACLVGMFEVQHAPESSVLPSGAAETPLRSETANQGASELQGERTARRSLHVSWLLLAWSAHRMPQKRAFNRQRAVFTSVRRPAAHGASHDASDGAEDSERSPSPSGAADTEEMDEETPDVAQLATIARALWLPSYDELFDADPAEGTTSPGGKCATDRRL